MADSWTIIGGTTAFVELLVAVQGYWIGRVLDLLRGDVTALRDDVSQLRHDVTSSKTELATLRHDV